MFMNCKYQYKELDYGNCVSSQSLQLSDSTKPVMALCGKALIFLTKIQRKEVIFLIPENGNEPSFVRIHFEDTLGGIFQD